MRKSILVISVATALVLTFTSCGSTKSLPSPDPISRTIQLLSNKNSNFIKANEWMVNTFGNAESVIQFTDKEEGIVKGKYIMSQGVSGGQYTPSTSSYFATITLRVKDKRARIEIESTDQFTVYNYMGTNYGFTPEQFTTMANELVVDFESHMNKKSANDSW
jgi:hypothetical protein